MLLWRDCIPANDWHVNPKTLCTKFISWLGIHIQKKVTPFSRSMYIEFGLILQTLEVVVEAHFIEVQIFKLATPSSEVHELLVIP